MLDHFTSTSHCLKPIFIVKTTLMTHVHPFSPLVHCLNPIFPGQSRLKNTPHFAPRIRWPCLGPQPEDSPRVPCGAPVATKPHSVGVHIPPVAMVYTQITLQIESYDYSILRGYKPIYNVWGDQLSSWAAGGSLEFSVEIQHSSRWPGPIKWSALSSAQQSRSRRLMSILKAAFHENPRCVALVNAFSEGVALHAVGQGDRMSVAVNQQSNGYELLRQLTLEFSIRSRSEALSLRTQIAGRSFVLPAARTSPSSLVSDVIRKIDFEAARFSRLLGTFPMHVDTTGLKLADSDMLVVLLRSLPEAVKNYILHHSSADTYEAYRNAAMRWEEQHLLFNDFEVSGKKVNNLSLESGTGGSVEYYSFDSDWNASTQWLETVVQSVVVESMVLGLALWTLAGWSVFVVVNLDILVRIVLLVQNKMEKEKVVRKENRDLWSPTCGTRRVPKAEKSLKVAKVEKERKASWMKLQRVGLRIGNLTFELWKSGRDLSTSSSRRFCLDWSSTPSRYKENGQGRCWVRVKWGSYFLYSFDSRLQMHFYLQKRNSPKPMHAVDSSSKKVLVHPPGWMWTFTTGSEMNPFSSVCFPSQSFRNSHHANRRGWTKERMPFSSLEMGWWVTDMCSQWGTLRTESGSLQDPNLSKTAWWCAWFQRRPLSCGSLLLKRCMGILSSTGWGSKCLTSPQGGRWRKTGGCCRHGPNLFEIHCRSGPAWIGSTGQRRPARGAQVRGQKSYLCLHDAIQLLLEMVKPYNDMFSISFTFSCTIWCSYYWKWRNLWTRRFSFLCRFDTGRCNLCFGWWNAQQEISHLL